MTGSRPERAAHIVSDIASRAVKADKIIGLLSKRRSFCGQRVLEVGCGTGVLAARLGAEVGESGSAVAVDRVDERVAQEGYRFVLVGGVDLPFRDGSFDVVVSNHVIEHVGTGDDQARHVAELVRVSSPTGLIYLAGPNRWQLMEPHYRLPLLGWLPQAWADRYVRISGRGDWYDVRPPTRREIRRHAAETAFALHDLTGELARATAALEGGRGVRRIAFAVGATVFELLPSAAPTQAVLLSDPASPASAEPSDEPPRHPNRS